MTVVRKTVTFTTQQDKWIKAQIEAGEFTNDSEYLRNLVRQDQEKNVKFLALKKALNEGIESGVSARTLPEIMEAVEERIRADGSL